MTPSTENPKRIGGTAHLSPERRSEIARLAGLARNTPERRFVGKRGPQPCHDPAIPDECTRCRRRASEKRSRAKKMAGA